MPSYARLASVGAVARAVVPAVRPGGPSLGERAGAVPRLVRATFSGEYTGVTKGRLVLMLAAAGYIVSPVDLIPEAVFPILGLADDALVLSWLATAVVEETEAFLAWERAQGAPTRSDARRLRRHGRTSARLAGPGRPAGPARERGDPPAATQTVPRRRRPLTPLRRRRGRRHDPRAPAPRSSTGSRGALVVHRIDARPVAVADGAGSVAA